MNQNSEQLAQNEIGRRLLSSGWLIPGKSYINLFRGLGVVVTQHQTHVGLPNYTLFLNKEPIWLIEAKCKEESVALMAYEVQLPQCTTCKRKCVNNAPVSFVYEGSSEVVRFIDYRDAKLHFLRPLTFYCLQTFEPCLRQDETLHANLQGIPALKLEDMRNCLATASPNLEKFLQEAQLRALAQILTDSSKTFTAITFHRSLLKFAKVSVLSNPCINLQ